MSSPDWLHKLRSLRGRRTTRPRTIPWPALFGLAAFASIAEAADGPAAQDPGRDLLLVLALVLVNALFAMAEAALLSVRRSRIDQLVEEGNRAARLASRLLNDPTRMLSTLQVGVTLVGLFSAGVAAEHLVEPLAAWITAHLPPGFLVDHAKSIAFAVTILGVSLVSLVIGEITPKSIAIRHAERIALVTVYPMKWLQTMATPLVALVTRLSGLITRPFGVTAGFHPSALGEDELRLLVEQSEEHGVIDQDEKEMIHSIFDFGETRAREVMTPRLDVAGLPIHSDVATMVAKVESSGHSRLPVYDGDLDRIVGVVHIKDALPSLAAGRLTAPIKQLMRPPYFIPEHKLVADLMTELRRDKGQLALVRDEYGTFTGVVSLEDLLEEIVGEIRDEHEREAEDVPLTTLDERTFMVSGRMSLDEFNERMGTELPAEDADTFGGYVFGLFGHQPSHGETVDADGFSFQVAQTDGRRILKVRVTRTTNPATVESAEKEVP
ncbi:MAG: hemolysin family protein [Candidatus Eisenbacteria bacterium]